MVQSHILYYKGLQIDLRKNRLDDQVRIHASAAAQKGDCNPAFFRKLLESGRENIPPTMIPEFISAFCVVALDLGFRDFVHEYRSEICVGEENEEAKEGLVQAARKVCKTDSPLELFSILTTTPLRANGMLHQRDGNLIRIDFEDGKKAFCKSRSPHEEAVSFELLRLCGLPSHDYSILGDWIIMQAAPGRNVFEHIVLPGLDTPDLSVGGRELFRRMVAIIAFDYIFGMLDRNPGGIVFGNGLPTTAIDNEHPFAFYPIPSQGRSLLGYRAHFSIIGLDQRLVTDDTALNDNLDYAAELFGCAGANLARILRTAAEHIARYPMLDCTIFNIARDSDTLQEILVRISNGVSGFRDKMLEEMTAERRLGIFPAP